MINTANRIWWWCWQRCQRWYWW